MKKEVGKQIFYKGDVLIKGVGTIKSEDVVTLQTMDF